MYPGRKLLFHRNDVDDSIGTYVTDYIIGAVCFAVVGFLIYKVLRNKSADDERVLSSWRHGDTGQCCYWSPWNWPRPIMTSITMTTYAAISFTLSYGLMMFVGGFPHQFLQEVEPYEDWRDSWPWLIIWRTAAGFVAIAFPSLLTLLEQTLHQEGILSLRRVVRQIFYFVLMAVAVCTIAANFYRLGDQHNPYDIEKIYLSFVSCITLYGIGMLVVVIRTHCFCCKRRSMEKELHNSIETAEEMCSTPIVDGREPHTNVRWDLILHCMVPWIMVTGGVFSYILTPKCSHSDHAQEEFGCPLPDVFNHNAVMHTFQLTAMLITGFAENTAINRRARLCDVINTSDVTTDNETESLASSV